MRKQNKMTILEYLNLDLKQIPDSIKNTDDIDIKASEIRNEKNYKVYKHLPIKQINIVMTNARRLDEPAKKVENMKDLSYYLNKKNEEEYESFLNLLENASTNEVQEIEKFQRSMKNNKPSKIKYIKDYIWQIYYIKRTNKYYMIVPLQETEIQGFLYVLKKKISNSNEKIYVPICNLEYSNTILENSKISTLENNLHFFTNQWPMIYEVYDSKNNVSINIIGNLKIYENINTDYKMNFENKEDITLFYKLIKTLFYLQTELSNYFKFDIVLDENGAIHFYYEDVEINNSNLEDFYSSEIKRNLKSLEEVERIQTALTKKLNKLKIQEKNLNTELLNKQKQISTFLECKKTFFGRVKYFFKYNKKKMQNNNIEIFEEENEEIDAGTIKHKYSNDIEDLISVCKEVRAKTTIAATTRLDIQNLGIKIEVLKKKIENASLYIQEIESHKKSIFEFWKFTNKDEKSQLAEGIIKTENERKIEKIFNIEEDLAEFSKYIDAKQRQELTGQELDSILSAIYIGLENINKESISKSDLKELIAKENFIEIDETVLTHREKIKNPKNILDIFEDITEEEITLKIKEVLKTLEKAFKKCKLNMNMSVYGLEKPENKIMKLEINPQKLILESEEINLYKLNLKTGMNILALSNIVYFNNRNETLPLGMDYSTNVLVDLRKAEILKIGAKTNYIIKLSDVSSKYTVTKINITEFNI